MAKELQPCGTHAAYRRHLRRQEEPCAPCRAANVQRMLKTPSGGEPTPVDRALALDPPIIVWRLHPVRRVMVAVSVHDPHLTGGRNAEKTHCKHGHEFTEDNTLITPTGRQCRTCKNKVTSEWQKNHTLTPEQRERKSRLERERRRQRKEAA